LNEALSFGMIYTIGTNAVNANIYVLLEYLLLLLQFYKWCNTLKKACIALALFGILVWVGDNFILNTIQNNNALFRIFYSSVIFLLSIIQLNNTITGEHKSLSKNAIFLLCTTFLVYYSCKAFVEVVNLFVVQQNSLFNLNIFMILDVANFFSYIIYTIAILCIPGKQEFIMQY
jgi:hypothetical protein